MEETELKKIKAMKTSELLDRLGNDDTYGDDDFDWDQFEAESGELSNRAPFEGYDERLANIDRDIEGIKKFLNRSNLSVACGVDDFIDEE